MAEIESLDLKEYQFITSVIEGSIEFDSDESRNKINSSGLLEDFPYMKTSYFKEKNLLLMDEFSLLLKSCQTFYSRVAKKFNFDTYDIMSSWIQTYDIGKFHDTHIHYPLKDNWNFVFFLDCDENSSNLVICEPGYPYVNNGNRTTIKPEIGKCVAFPGYLPHFVEPNKEKRRTILSSNLQFYRKGKQ